MPKSCELTAKTEAWMREHIPGWGELRDKAVAAGLIDPALPMSETQKLAVQELAGRVRRRLAVSAGSRAAARSFNEEEEDAEKEA